MAEFTGERVIPGEVDTDLWNEHVARYLFAARLARQKRVLDIACGTGYGTHELAGTATSAVGIDRAPEAIQYASSHFGRSNLTFLQASAGELPFPDSSFDLITAFEVIEHLGDWHRLLAEARRLLRPGGQFVVSTPNKLYYAQSREQAGPNPFHEHEFTFDEFRMALEEFFPAATLFVQNHSEAVVFQPVGVRSAAELRLETGSPDTSTCHFFLAVCALTPQMGAPAFAFLPSAANVLRERELHIARLEQELQKKDLWLDELKTEHATLVERFRGQTADLEARNNWALQLNDELAEASQNVSRLETELAAEQLAGREMADGYEVKIAELNGEVAARTKWAIDTEERLTGELRAKCEELANCVQLLKDAETSLEERTKWALQLSREREEILTQLNLVQSSRWYRMGRKFGLGPEVRTA